MSFLNLFKKLKLWNLKNKILKIEHKKIFRGPSKILKNISWPINICLKYFMAPTKSLRHPPPSYILNVRSLTCRTSSISLFSKLDWAMKTKYLVIKRNSIILWMSVNKLPDSNSGNFQIQALWIPINQNWWG